MTTRPDALDDDLDEGPLPDAPAGSPDAGAGLLPARHDRGGMRRDLDDARALTERALAGLLGELAARRPGPSAGDA